MLPYLFAIAIAVASLSLFVTAFFSPNWHRRDDFLWSGIGLIYALVLWICAEQMRGSVLLGQGAATVLVLSLIWQTVQLRKLLAISDKRTELTALSFTAAVQGLFAQKKKGIAPKSTPGGVTVPAPMTAPMTAKVEPKIEPPKSAESAIAQTQEKLSEAVKSLEESIPENPVLASPTETLDEAATLGDFIQNIDLEQTLEEVISSETLPKDPISVPPITPKFPTVSANPPAPTPKKSGFSLTSLFGRKKPKTDNIPNLKPEALTELLDRQDEVLNAQKDAEWDEVTATVTEAIAPAQSPLEAVIETVTEVTASTAAEDGEWDEMFEAIATETPLDEELKEAVTDAVTDAIAPLQEQLEALTDSLSDLIEEQPSSGDAIADQAALGEIEDNPFLEQLQAEAERKILDSESGQ